MQALHLVWLVLAVATAGCTRDKECAKLQGLVRQLAQLELEQTRATVPVGSVPDEIDDATRRSLDRAAEAVADRCVALPDDAFECVAPLSEALPTFLGQMSRCAADDSDCRAAAGARAKAWISAPCQTVLRRVYCRGTDAECAQKNATAPQPR